MPLLELPWVAWVPFQWIPCKKELIPFVLLGYVCAAYLNIPTIGIAIVGTIFALIEFYNKPKTADHVVEEEAHDDWI